MCWRRPLQAVACWRLTEDFIADYQQRLPSLPVRSSVQPGYLRPRLPEAAPEQPQGLPDILAHVDAHIDDYIAAHTDAYVAGPRRGPRTSCRT